MRVLGMPQTEGDNCIQLIETMLGDRFDIHGHVVENAHRTGKPSPDHPRHITVRFYSRVRQANAMRSAREKLANTTYRIVDDLAQEDALQKRKLRPLMNEPYRHNKRPSFRNDVRDVKSLTTKSRTFLATRETPYSNVV